ncbi:nitrous oxide reductase family maturation protein NosD [Candidatus Kryptobacter tengchongensis]|uniref:nitrous oxide reductase family maturation protein NosD n=1 Tax=Kryptobacter tengchongensis TaxID=1643429 RepID=UPI0007074124|nr:nitrous oxide reductase family maturation protein NosD [Candidatus Kryptobacter tengchongensis]CUS93050.1 nitrous oxidase accessory protein [Candidatus Kryptobacter tengchongensis]
MREFFKHIFFFLFSFGLLNAEVLKVGGKYDFKSIKDALAVAKPHDTIYVYPGEYYGNIFIDKPIVLIGIGRPWIKGENWGSTVTVLADSCVINGFKITGGGNLLQKEDSGILLKSASYNKVENNLLEDILFGIYFFASNNNVVRHNTIIGRPYLGIGERGSGLHIWNSRGNLIEENFITKVRDGMYIQEASNNFIRRNYATDLRYGIHYMFSDSNSFEENVFIDNVVGGAVMYSRHIYFKRNIFARNRGFSSYGLLLQSCDYCVAEENYVLDNSIGLHFEGTNYNVIRRNLIQNNDLAIVLFASANYDKIYENNFIGNLALIRTIGNPKTTLFSYEGKGNYWDGYLGYDLDDDGVGDVRFRLTNVFEYIQGKYPIIQLYLSSPSAKAIELAERAMPIIKSFKIYDEHPLMKKVDLPDLSYLVKRGKIEKLEKERIAFVSVSFITLCIFIPFLTLVMKSKRLRKIYAFG